jgi:hypothetical protein
MLRLSQFFRVTIANRIVLAVSALRFGPAPVLIPIPVKAKQVTQLTRRIR